MQFYSLKASKKKDIVLPQELIYVATEGDLDYFIGVHKEKTSYPDLIEMVIEKPLGLVLCDLKDVEKEIRHQEQILQDASNHYASLEKQLLQELDEAHLRQAKGFSKSRLEEKVFSIEAYIPENKEKEFEALFQAAGHQPSSAVYFLLEPDHQQKPWHQRRVPEWNSDWNLSNCWLLCGWTSRREFPA